MTRLRSKNSLCTDLDRPRLWLLVLALLLPLVGGCSPKPDEPPVQEPPPHQGMN
jgi:hypothetical protein